MWFDKCYVFEILLAIMVLYFKTMWNKCYKKNFFIINAFDIIGSF